MTLGCFDHEEEAAKAYDKMMLWCDLHNAGGVKGGITNFEAAEYEAELTWLRDCTQVWLPHQGDPSVCMVLCTQLDSVLPCTSFRTTFRDDCHSNACPV